jgi:fructose-bisphosphate aldolase, class II
MLLSPTQAKTCLADTLAAGRAILAVNADSPAAISDCLEAAHQADSPIIIETSLWQLTGRSFGAGDAIRGLVRYLVQLSAFANAEPYRDVPVIFHTDHIKGPETLRILEAAIRGAEAEICGAAVRVFASTVSLDSSELTAAQNIEHICTLCEIARESGRDVALEMEAGVDDGLTPPETTRRLLSAVEEKYPGRIVFWAPGLGTRHGFSAEGYPEFSSEAVARQRALAREITGRDIGLALHGSSGLPRANLRAAVEAGVVKVNWSSESLLLRSRAAAEYYSSHAAQLEKSHPDWKAAAMDNGVQLFVSKRYIPALLDRIRLLNRNEPLSSASESESEG